eukprot:13025353-Alexandrium_andersonii.AAC.1
MSRLWTPSIPPFVGSFGICGRHGAERTYREPRGPNLRPFLGPCSFQVPTAPQLLRAPRALRPGAVPQ